MILLTLVAALVQPLPITGYSSSPERMLLGDAPVVCNPDQTKGLACHMNKAHTQARAHYARRQTAAAACDPKAGNTRGCAKLSAQEAEKDALSN